MFYDKDFMEMADCIKINDTDNTNVEKLLAMISTQLCNVANELHELNTLTKSMSCVPDKMILNSEGMEVKYKSIDEIVEKE